MKASESGSFRSEDHARSRFDLNLLVGGCPLTRPTTTWA
jgi:hypothetical protein